MDIFEFVSSYKNHPVLFVGTGLSLRYLNNSFNWEGLLKYVAIDLYGTDEKFYDMKNKVHKTHDGIRANLRLKLLKYIIIIAWKIKKVVVFINALTQNTTTVAYHDSFSTVITSTSFKYWTNGDKL